MALKVVPRGGLRELSLDAIRPCADQPRRRFGEEGLKELCESIRQVGVLEPILVSETPGGAYEILAGERRWRAAGMGGGARGPPPGGADRAGGGRGEGPGVVHGAGPGGTDERG